MSMSFASASTGGLPKALCSRETRYLSRSVDACLSPVKLSLGSRYLVQFSQSKRYHVQCVVGTGLEEYKKETGNDFSKTTSVEHDRKKDVDSYKGALDKTRELVNLIQSKMKKMEDGEISMSPYDTAWVAMVEDIHGGGPQFPSTLDWISKNQLADGSWGDPNTFLVYDRLLNTLGCVVAFKTWKMHPRKCDKAISFIRDNMNKLDDENEEHMLNGFEVTFPRLIEKAKELNINIPDDSPGLRKIFAQRDVKLKRIPSDVLHSVPTTLLFSLEGVPFAAEALDWQKLMKLQSTDGSFGFSPASTAFAFQQTRDQNCLQYLLKIVHRFNGGVPNVYPVDLFEHNWIVDRLQRLGISRYFESEIKKCMQYVQRYWSNDDGMYAVRNSKIQDVDDTSMAFRVLRLHGFDVSPDALKQFKNGEEFYCFAGQTSHSVTATYNLYRASQVMFPGEKILEDARKFSTKFLREKRANNELFDKWIITKDLAGEVGYALDIPWYASLPRVEARFFIEQYGGYDDVWIGKVLYRMLNVNNKDFLELAKLDYNDCQSLHQQELKSIHQWYKRCGLREFGLKEESLLHAYYIAAASVFEPEKSRERLAWAKISTLMKTISAQKLTKDQKHEFIQEFEQGSTLMITTEQRYNTSNNLLETLIATVHKMSLDTPSTQDRDTNQQILNAWRKWLAAWEKGGDGDAELLVETLNIIGGSDGSSFFHPKYKKLLVVTTRICHQLRLLQKPKVKEIQGGGTVQVDPNMQELVKLVLTKSAGDLDCQIKQRFLAIARSFYYATHCSPETISFHIVKVLFERVV